VRLMGLLAVPLVALGVSVLFACEPEEPSRYEEGENSLGSMLWSETSSEDLQHVSLFKKYTFDYVEALKIREENMKKYSFKYNRKGVDKRSDLSLQEFWDVYDAKWPVIVTDVLPTWPAFNWSRDFFYENYKDERVTMKAVDSPSLQDAVSLALPLELFYKNTHKAYPHQWTYLEDELFIPTRPELRASIGPTIYLQEDHYKLFPQEVRPWDAMLLWGTQYSRSSLHIDPYNWTGTNAVISGRKSWKLFPPGQDHYLDVVHGQMSGFPLNCYKYNSAVDSFEPNTCKHPNFTKSRYLEFEQLPGELLIIPTGWFHQAYNLEETIAVSSQVMNRNNYRIVLEEIIKVGNIQRKQLPRNVNNMTPAEQVAVVMSLLPADVIKRGKEVTQDIIDQVQGVAHQNAPVPHQ